MTTYQRWCLNNALGWLAAVQAHAGSTWSQRFRCRIAQRLIEPMLVSDRWSHWRNRLACSLLWDEPS